MKTLIEPSPEVAEELSHPKWKEPRHAYILLEMPKNYLSANAEPRSCMSSVIINVQNRPDVGFKLVQYMKKGARILHYGNFPSSSSTSPQVQNLVKLHSGGKGNPWDALAGEVRGMMGVERRQFATAEAHYAGKLAELQAKIDKLEQGKKNDKQKADSIASGI